MSTRILVINPNSSQKVTKGLKDILSAPKDTAFEYYTAPAEGPEEITPETSEISGRVALADLLRRGVTDQYDGFLVCCYSDHPLVHSLAEHTAKPILGIMQATLLYALLHPGKLFILTSVNDWEPVLDKGIIDFVGCEPGAFPRRKFQKTKGLDVSVLGLSDPLEFAKIVKRVQEILHEYAEDKIATVLLGCAGMAGLDEKLARAFPGIHFVDSCKIGVDLLGGLVRFQKQ